MKRRHTLALAAAVGVALAAPARADWLPSNYFTIKPILPDRDPATGEPAILTYNSTADSYAGIRLVAPAVQYPFEQMLLGRSFWSSPDPSWVGVYADDPSVHFSSLPRLPVGAEVTVTDPVTHETGTLTFSKNMVFIGTVGPDGGSVGVGGDPSPSDEPTTLTVGGHTFIVNFSPLGAVDLVPDGPGYEVPFMHVDVDAPWWSPGQTPPDGGPPPGGPGTPGAPQAPEPGSLALAVCGLTGMAGYRRWRRRPGRAAGTGGQIGDSVGSGRA